MRECVFGEAGEPALRHDVRAEYGDGLFAVAEGVEAGEFRDVGVRELLDEGFTVGGAVEIDVLVGYSFDAERVVWVGGDGGGGGGGDEAVGFGLFGVFGGGAQVEDSSDFEVGEETGAVGGGGGVGAGAAVEEVGLQVGVGGGGRGRGCVDLGGDVAEIEDVVEGFQRGVCHLDGARAV